MIERKFSRREILKGMVKGAAAIAIGGSIAGCESTPTPSPEADLIDNLISLIGKTDEAKEIFSSSVKGEPGREDRIERFIERSKEGATSLVIYYKSIKVKDMRSMTLSSW